MANFDGTDAGETLNGTNAEDFIRGFGGDDKIRARKGSDAAFGGDGSDIIKGAAGTDALFGEAGNDKLSGGKSDDSLTGGFGADVFIFQGISGDDAILDFQDCVDRIKFKVPGIDDISDLERAGWHDHQLGVGGAERLGDGGVPAALVLHGGRLHLRLRVCERMPASPEIVARSPMITMGILSQVRLIYSL